MGVRFDAALSRWTGEFLEAEHERTYQADAWPRLARQLRLIAVIAGGMYIAALYMNWKGFGNGFAFRTMVALRLGTGITLWGIAFASRPEWPPKRVNILFLVTILCMVATRLVESQLVTPLAYPGVPAPVSVIPVMPLIIYAVLAIPARLAVVWSGVGSLLFLRDQAILWGIDAPATQGMLLNLVLANGAGYAVRVAWNRITRRDYALRRALEQEVAERQNAEQAAQRANAAKSRFLAVMSHEIRTPLNAVLGGVQLLQESELRPEQRPFVDMLGRSGHQLAALLDDVLDLARIEAERLDLVREPFSPAELLASVHAVVYPQARAKGLALRLEHPAELPTALEGDALRLRQVLINLVGNAVKFTERGEVVLSLALSPTAGRMRCAFAVRDTGPGLSAEAQARVFAPFEQGDMSTRRRHGGAGLGLAISRELVAAMGGELAVESAPGEGCVFRFVLELPVCAAREPAAPPSKKASPLSILVVDDVEANLIVAGGLLASLGHRVRTATAGAAALEMLRTETFDAVLLDLHMQGMDGLDVLQRIRGLAGGPAMKPPVFLMTADTERSRIQACLDAGAQGVLPKPFRKARLAELLEGYAAHQEPAVVPRLVDGPRVARMITDLGTEAWDAGLRACRTSAEACLKELEDPSLASKALHRLAGISASFCMPGLYQLVRRAEALLAAGEPCPFEELRTVAACSLTQLESTLRN